MNGVKLRVELMKTTEKERRAKARQLEKGVFVGAWVPRTMADRVNRAYKKHGFKDQGAFVRAVLEFAVEEVD